jgi:hypothetical protein
MNAFPLQEPLIDAALDFANVNLTDIGQVRAIFAGTWKPDAIPTLATCRKIQRELRAWLEKPSLYPGDAMMREIELTGRLGSRNATIFNDDPYPRPIGNRFVITWRWWIKSATLRGICGLAIMSIDQAQSEEKIGRVARCARGDCGRYFVDRSSRGTPRAYCGAEECEKARTRERVSKSRRKP